ncbi:MAG TPA: hypothetical protein VHU13_03410 [Solirubrobacteraceae bacterium]|jgi:hypothetical protein|nr:hypothetical protein [Solirubrobacteraceae bacterium]
MAAATFITLGPEGTCHEHALRHYLDFQGLADAPVELVGDFTAGLERVRELPNGFLVQCSSHPDVHIVTERYRQEVFVVDTFMFPAKEMGLIVRRDRPRPRSLGVVAAAMGYPDLEEWETIVQEPANPIVARELLAGKYDAGVTFVAFGEEHPQELEVRERYGEVDTTWVVYGKRRRYEGRLIGNRIPEFLNDERPDEHTAGHTAQGAGRLATA